MSQQLGPRIVVLQPGYLPWLGFFDQLRRSDIFVIYDDVQFDKHGWRNRNRIKSPNGPYWLTVPVRVNSLSERTLDVEIDNHTPWARKHLGTIEQFYAQAPYRKRYLPELAELLHGRWERIAELDIAIIKLICDWLGLQRRLVRASELGIEGQRSERLLKLCLHFGAGCYLSGDAAKDYLDTETFARHGIQVEWQGYRHPVYRQQHGEFIPYLSALDLLLNCGDESAAIIAGGA